MEGHKASVVRKKVGSKKGKCGGEGHGFSWDILTCKGEGLGPMAQISLALNFGAVFNFFREHRRQAGRGGAYSHGPQRF